jgi:low temperature requirement protein LtrA
MSDRAPTRGHRVTSLELFFDLVVVFAITQVTALLANRPDAGGVLRGCLVLAAIWWAWAAYAWLTNTIDPEEGAVRFVVFCSVGAMLVVALAAPEAFGDDAIAFGVAYLVVRLLHLVLYAIAGRGDPDLLRAVLRIAPTATIAPILLVVAGFLHGSLQLGVWVIALAIDYLGVLVGHMEGWRVSPAHFAERHGLMMIIALGESIVAIGIGAAGEPLGAGVIVAALLGIAIAAALWWSYFDWVAIIVRQRLAELNGAARARLARDGYSYLHLPMVAGIVLFALGLKETIEDLHDPLETTAAVGLCGGVALYFAAHVALRVRIGGGIGHGRPVATLLLLALLPFARNLSAIVTLAVVAAICAALIGYEAIRYRSSRAEIRLDRDA